MRGDCPLHPQPLAWRGRLPVRLRELLVPAPLGHGVGCPRCPAASGCHPPLPQGQLTGAFDSPACSTQRPAGRQPCLAVRSSPQCQCTEGCPQRRVPAEAGAPRGGCPQRQVPRRRPLWPKRQCSCGERRRDTQEAGGRASPRPCAPFLCGPEQSHTHWALVPTCKSVGCGRRRSSAGLRGSPGCFSPSQLACLRLGRAGKRGTEMF